MLSGLEKILSPKGRAFTVLERSNREKIHKAIHSCENDFLSVVDSFKESLYPDNNKITHSEISFLEYSYGLGNMSYLNIEERKENILAKIKRRNLNKQSLQYLQYRLNLQGFDVNIFENGTGVVPLNFLSGENIQHSDAEQHGLGVQMGLQQAFIIGNSIDENESIYINESSKWAFFFITGQDMDTPAEIPYDRIKQFRELVLKIKPAHLVAVTNIIKSDSINPIGDFNNDFNNDFFI